jgi:dihydrodipicolinate reductase
MTNIMLSGCGGRLAKSIAAQIAASDYANVAVGIEINPTATELATPYPILTNPADFTGSCDVIIDASHHTAAIPLLTYAKAHKIPVVIATTGHTDEETAAIKKTAEEIPVFYSRNMSVGINLLMALVEKTAKILGEEFNIEIIEKHHNKKLDAPSGTALMLADAAAEGVPYDPKYTYSRNTVRKERASNEIGIHSIRGGTIVGEHEVAFCGPEEIVTLSHSAQSRDVFASGAVRAALYLISKPAGYYNMQDLVGEI